MDIAWNDDLVPLLLKRYPASDNMGPPPVNLAVALTFPKLRAKYGDSVTYEQNPKAHVQTEFGFDITQVAKQWFTSDRYHDFIGFQVSKPLLERAFLRTDASSF